MRLFFSRDREQAKEIFDAFPDWEIQAESLISFESTGNISDEKHSWIFFTSKQTVDFYLEKNTITDEKIACLGSATANYLYGKGYQVNFVGAGKDSSQIGKDFAKGYRGKVLFPQSNISLQKVQKELPKEDYTDLVVYNTILVTDNVPDCDYYVFTSPSNVEAFFEVNTLTDKAICFVLGDTTKEALESKGISNIVVSEEPRILSLVEAIKSRNHESETR